VDWCTCNGLVGDDGPEEVGAITQGLVADHHGPLLHHPTLQNIIIVVMVPFFIVLPCI
jgi:hypothetical protein